jgi:hypothetical protein
MTAILDHRAIGTRALSRGWELLDGVLHPREAHGIVIQDRLDACGYIDTAR